MFGPIGAAIGGVGGAMRQTVRRGPVGAAAGIGSGGGVAAGIANRMRDTPPGMSTSMGSAVPAVGLGAASDMKPPAGDRNPTEPRTFEHGPNMTMPAEYRGQGSSLRSATRRNARRAGRALSR